MRDDLIARASTIINAPREVVWNALVNPEAIERFMFGTQVESDWHEGHPITWRGEWNGKKYEDKGVIQKVKPLRRLEYTHFSPLSGKLDVPESYHHVIIELADEGPRTQVTITQNRNESEEVRSHSEKNWASTLAALKSLLESSHGSFAHSAHY